MNKMASPYLPHSATTLDYHLLPDYNDDPSEILVSFPEIKRQTTQALYSNSSKNNGTSSSVNESTYRAVDKSPKGSVDEPIQPLVDLINHHPSFSTLSSCSGRIALFEPSGLGNKSSIGAAPEFSESSDANNYNNTHGLEVTNNKNDNDTQAGGTESGKGRGGWLLVSHEMIDASRLQKIFDEHSDDTPDPGPMVDGVEKALVFKLEPMLLHVAAATMDRGRQLLNLALGLGFRESGIVVPNKRNHRVTVAIRGVSLALTVPLGFQGPLRPSKEYLKALVAQANYRLEQNQTKIHKLYESVKANLFQQKSLTETLELCCDPLPDLNLWGHDVVAVTPRGNNGHNNMDILAFGGYGQGPLLEKGGAKDPCQRSGEVYRLRRSDGIWATHWEMITEPTISNVGMQETKRLYCDGVHVNVRCAHFTPREGIATFQLQGSDIIGIWGGRKGPNSPLDDFFLYEYSDESQYNGFWTPIDIRGEKPAPRWGHTMSSLDSSIPIYKSSKRLAILIGGRNERTALESIHLLSLIQNDTPEDSISAHFLWETVSFSPLLRRSAIPFHHSTVAFSQKGNGVNIFVFGGMSNPTKLLEPFSTVPCGDTSTTETDAAASRDAVVTYMLTLNSERPRLSALNMVNHSSITQAINFGGAATSFRGPRSEVGTDRELILLSGGVPRQHQEGQHDISNAAIHLVEVSKVASEDTGGGQETWCLQPSKVSGISMNDLNDTPMVHHHALAVPSYSSDREEVILLGGGVMGFVFGPCFSRSYRVQVLPSGKTVERYQAQPSTLQQTQSKTNDAVPTTKDKESILPQTTHVVYVKKHNAKALKTALESLSLLDKTFRMTPISTKSDMDEEGCRDLIAVPVKESCLPLVLSQNQSGHKWVSLVEGTGQEQMPYSTARFAKQKKK